jgi:ubiquitin-protein ligase E3 C
VFIDLTKFAEEEGTSMLSTRDIRTLSILREVPFVFSFTDRVKMWQQWIMSDKMQQQNEANFLRGPSIQVMIRRNYIYEDAFDKLSPDNGNYALFACQLYVVQQS